MFFEYIYKNWNKLKEEEIYSLFRKYDISHIYIYHKYDYKTGDKVYDVWYQKLDVENKLISGKWVYISSDLSIYEIPLSHSSTTISELKIDVHKSVQDVTREVISGRSIFDINSSSGWNLLVIKGFQIPDVIKSKQDTEKSTESQYLEFSIQPETGKKYYLIYLPTLYFLFGIFVTGAAFAFYVYKIFKVKNL
jgi:hypothetical protein